MKKLIFIIYLLAGTAAIFAQGAASEQDAIESRLNEQVTNFPHEKIYVQTDKSTYLSGERIWLRSHLVDANTNKPAFVSRYVYLELFNPFGELITRVKIRPDSVGAYAGHLNLDDDLPEGSYTLRAYTRYMRNQGNESFFKKTITVLDPYSLQIEAIPNFTIKQNKVNANFKFVDRQNGDTIKPSIVTLKLSDETTKTVSPKNNDYNWNFTLSEKRSNRNLLLGIVNNGRKFNKYYAIPYDANEFDVTFHPEGGYLIPGQACQMGFKAINPAGISEEISGTLFNSKDEEILRFESFKFGMGFFSFFPSPDEKYYAVCQTINGSSKRVDLPLPEAKSRIICARLVGNKIITSILKGDAAPTDSVSLLIHNKGIPLYHQRWAANTNVYTFPSNIFPSGILNFLLLNGNNDILSERLVFNINENDFADVETTSSAPSYKQRQRIALKLRLEDTDSTAVANNNMAVSVVDKNAAAQDSTTNLISTLLLSSELKGFIESPASYFINNKADKFALDALMMTQGWKRYDIPSVLKGKISAPGQFTPEQFQEITGKTEALFRSMNEGEISLIATLDSLFSGETTTADPKGRFMFKVEYPENTEITIQSRGKRKGKDSSKPGSGNNLISIDPITFPDYALSTLPAKARYTQQTDFDFDAYMKKANEDYTQRNGIRTIMLEEVTVTAKAKEKYKESKFYSPISSSGLLTAEDIEKRKASSLKSLLISSPGIVVKSDKVTTTRSEMPVLFVIDDMTYEDFFDRIDDIDVNSIDNFFIMKDNTSMLGYYPNTSGAVVITTKGGFVQKNTKSMNIDRIKPLGYQPAAEFYSPMYETKEQKESGTPDLRTTIYWKPNVQFSQTGEASIEFYSADASTTYQIVGEGVANSGKIIHFAKEITVISDDKQ